MKRFLVQIWTEIGHSGSKTITYGNEIVIKLVFYCGLIVWFFLSRISPPNMPFLSLWWQYVTYYYNFSVCWENDDFRFFIEKLWNEWECWTSAQTVLITCQKNRFYSFVNYEYYFNSYHPEKVQIQNWNQSFSRSNKTIFSQK